MAKCEVMVKGIQSNVSIQFTCDEDENKLENNGLLRGGCCNVSKNFLEIEESIARMQHHNVLCS